MAVVILWFSFQQFLHNSTWVAYIPDSIVSLTHIDAPTLVLMNAIVRKDFSIEHSAGFKAEFFS